MDFIGNKAEALYNLLQLNPIKYAKTRNFLNGKVTKLSPYLRHGLITPKEVAEAAINAVSDKSHAEKFLQQLSWREFFHAIYDKHPEWMWQNIEDYKTGFSENDYQEVIPQDILEGKTETACINHFIMTLIETGYLHNHARLYLASYIVHFRKIKWKTAAKWFLRNLIDGDIASNNLSFQWVASTFSHKPYIFNLENVDKYSPKDINTNPEDNKLLAKSYEELAKTLFPKLAR